MAETVVTPPIAALAPTVNAVSQHEGNPFDNAIRQNAIDNVARLKSATPILSAAVEQGKLKVVGGIYRLGDSLGMAGST